MARKRNERMKQLLLLGFVLISVALVVLIWADGMRAGDEALPGYYRDLGNGSVEETPATLPAQQPGDDHHRRDGSGDSPETPTPGRNFDNEEM